MAIFSGSSRGGHRHRQRLVSRKQSPWLSARPWPDSRPAPTLADILADETAVFIMSIFRRRVDKSIGPFDESLRTNEDYDFWLRAACAGFVFYRNDQPLGYYRRRDNSLSADELRMLPGILQVFRKLRPQLLNTTARARDSGCARSHGSRLSMSRQRRGAPSRREISPRARRHLATLHGRRGGAVLRVAKLMARWTPALLSTVYNVRRARLALSRAARIGWREHGGAEVFGRHRDLQARRRPARHAGEPRHVCSPTARGKSSSSTTILPTTRARSSRRRRASFPVELRYLFEPEQGRSPALNAGIRIGARRDRRRPPMMTCGCRWTG